MSVADAVHAVLAAVSLIAAMPVLVVAAQVAAAIFGRRPTDASPRAGSGAGAEAQPPRVAVLMPAHDEAAGIGASIDALRPQLAHADRLLVVADNCTDDTARVARAAGADVVQRADPLRRGKGYALDFGVRALAASPPDVVVVVDADCIVGAGSLAHLAREAAASGRPVQALYLMRAPAGASMSQRWAEFAWIVRNLVRPLGAWRFGLPCQLMGSGMAFPWPLLQGASLANADLVEDMRLGIDFAAAGVPPLFCPSALVTSEFPQHGAATTSQRTRWEHGHLRLLLRAGPALLWQALRRASAALLAMALDLVVPPIALLVVVLGLCTAAAVGVGFASARWGAAAVALGATALLVVSLAAAWWRFGRSVLSVRDIAALPAYIVAKLPIYGAFLRSRQVDWVRTRRDAGRR